MFNVLYSVRGAPDFSWDVCRARSTANSTESKVSILVFWFYLVVYIFKRWNKVTPKIILISPLLCLYSRLTRWAITQANSCPHLSSSTASWLRPWCPPVELFTAAEDLDEGGSLWRVQWFGRLERDHCVFSLPDWLLAARGQRAGECHQHTFAGHLWTGFPLRPHSNIARKITFSSGTMSSYAIMNENWMILSWGVVQENINVVKYNYIFYYKKTPAVF